MSSCRRVVSSSAIFAARTARAPAVSRLPSFARAAPIVASISAPSLEGSIFWRALERIASIASPARLRISSSVRLLCPRCSNNGIDTLGSTPLSRASASNTSRCRRSAASSLSRCRRSAAPSFSRLRRSSSRSPANCNKSRNSESCSSAVMLPASSERSTLRPMPPGANVASLGSNAAARISAASTISAGINVLCGKSPRPRQARGQNMLQSRKHRFRIRVPAPVRPKVTSQPLLAALLDLLDLSTGYTLYNCRWCLPAPKFCCAFDSLGSALKCVGDCLCVARSSHSTSKI